MLFCAQTKTNLFWQSLGKIILEKALHSFYKNQNGLTVYDGHPISSLQLANHGIIYQQFLLLCSFYFIPKIIRVFSRYIIKIFISDI